MLKRQLKKAYPNGLPDNVEFSHFIELIEQAYTSMSEELSITERSLDLSCEELQQRHDTLSKILDALPDMSMWIDQNGVIRDIRVGCFNPPLVSKEDEHASITSLEFYKNSVPLQHFLTGHEKVGSKRGELELSCETFTYYVEARLTSVSKHRWLLVIRDISLRRKLIEMQSQRLDQIKRTQKQLQGLINAAPTGILITDESTKLVMVNDYICQKLSLSSDELLGRNPLSFIAKKYRLEYLSEIQKHISYDDTILDSRLDLTMSLPSNEDMQVEMAFSTLLFEDKKLVITAITDISERKRLEDQLRVLASTDPLTGAYNRRSFHELSHKAMSTSSREQQPFSILLLDLDFFKRVNDNYGHSAGDEVLITTVKTINDCIREADILGRHGGEEFVIALPNTDSKRAKEIANRIRQCIEEMRVHAEGNIITLTASIGLVTKTESCDFEKLINQADCYLYFAKDNGRNQVVDEQTYLSQN
jgi:diguanylate cyclase (GGDEF)-like protein/PAS domain S-box-containing protein